MSTKVKGFHGDTLIENADNVEVIDGEKTYIKFMIHEVYNNTQGASQEALVMNLPTGESVVLSADVVDRLFAFVERTSLFDRITPK